MADIHTLQTSNIITTDTIKSLIDRYVKDGLHHQMQFAEVIEIVSQNAQDYQFGKIRTKILYQQIKRQQMVDMIPYLSANLVTIPVVGQIVICYKMPSPTIDVRQNEVFDEYYYLGVLNINNRVNNNIFQGVSIIHMNQDEGDPDNALSGRQFYVDQSVQRSTYKQGDTIIEGRLGQRIKFTHTVDGQKLLPKVVIVSNNRSGEYQNPQNSGSYMCLQLTDEQKQIVTIYSDDQIHINTKQIHIDSQKQIKVKTQNVEVKADEVKITCGGSVITISDSGVQIDAPSGIDLKGDVNLVNGLPNSSFCSLPNCTFTGALHTTNKAINPSG